MNKFLIIPLVLVLVSSCQKEIEIEIATTEESEYLIYNESLECRPLETDNGFFLISLKDSVPRLVHIDQFGNSNTLINLSNYLEFSYDSVQNLNISQFANGNIMVAYTYNDTASDNSQVMIQALEIQKSGEVIDELNQPIPDYNNQNYSYLAASKNESSDWFVISSYSEQKMGMDIVSELSLQTTVYKRTGSIIEPQSTVLAFSNLSIYQSYTVANNNIVILLSENQSGPPDQITTNSAYTLLTILPDGTSNQKILEESFVSIDVVKQVNEGLILVGTLSIDIDQTSLMTIALDGNNNTQWEYSFTIATSFTPTCIQVVDNVSVLGGLTGNTREFNWNNVYDQTNNSISMYAVDFDGQIIWSNNQQTEFSTLIVGICLSDDGYAWLLTKKSFNIFDNIALLKTNLEGNLN